MPAYRLSVRARQKQPDTRTPAEKQVWEKVREITAKKRRADRKRVNESPEAPIIYSPSGDGLKRGPKKDLTRDDADKCGKTVSAAITPNEFAVIEKFRLSFRIPVTPSRFIRFLITEALRKCAVFELTRPGAFDERSNILTRLEAMEIDPEVQLFLGDRSES